ncbi:glycoside hydrolase family 47 protein [Thermothelomyces thermophilus ATCC 42464]|uniref:alpha-1,2-Mannosidase n=1 Tax=Thermothelomyces thermophilus (strain ATCC 42464 / BCRC 31852 / DSM 1799) TaxID=573729 RepID=G2Q0X3_THET4|nr:glycoside hydrolase family 47 protein [Thermothelomyces thermophilus ATCC 42464]AEO54071.1 glycoside hydrolase family 47 protein [Thermothelomyces thermophilus ATCC 42464]
MAVMSIRKFLRLALAAAVFLASYVFLSQTDFVYVVYKGRQWRSWKYVPSSFDWGKRPEAHPVEEDIMVRLPEGNPLQLPRVQHDFSADELSSSHNETQRARRDAVRKAAKRSWRAYSKHAWGRDQVAPQSLIGQDTFAGWGATLVDSLDTLWIMGMEKEFRDAVGHVATIDWDNATSGHCSLFETNIRYLGGLLSAYDLSQEQILLDKAVELGNMLYAAFDTPNHMPANSFSFDLAKEGKLTASDHEASAAVGSLSLEFTRLSQLTGDPKYYHAIDGVKRHLERTQDSTSLPGMWPIFVDLENDFLTPGTSYSLGASADSAYEYLSKMYALLGGLDPTYEKLHTKAMATAEKHVLFRPMLPDPAPDVLFPGTVLSNGRIVELSPEIQHLACFAGGMFALGGRLFRNEEHVEVGKRLARGCAWAYDAFPTGIMPEKAELIPCRVEEKEGRKKEEEGGEGDSNLAPCAWNETRWRERARERRAGELPPRGFAALLDPQYQLRPEAIESIFVLYRVTGKADLLDVAWRMFESVTAATRTRFAYSAIDDVRATGETGKLDSMESFWIAETLKYFYLIFSEPDLINLDDYVFNTEAHPFKRPRPNNGDEE